MSSIRIRLLAWLVLGQVGLLIVLNAAVWFFGGTLIMDAFDEHMSTDARAIGSLLSQSGPDFELEFSDELMPQYLPSDSQAYFEVWVEGAGVLERSRSLRIQGAPGGSVMSDLPKDSGTVDAPLAWNLELPGDVAGRAVGISFPVHEYAARNSVGRSLPRANATIVVAVDRAPLEEQLSKLRLGLAVLDIGLIVVSALLLNLGVDKGLRPMLKFADDLKSASTSEEALEMSWAAVPRELEPVKAAVRQLLERVDGSYQREKRLASNIAHELKTPIAELRAATDVALMKKNSRGALEDAVRTSQMIALEMESVVLAILQIWRSRANTARESETPVDPFEILQKSAASVASAMSERSLSMTVAGDRGLRVLARPKMLGLAVDNLMRNAVEHAVAGTEIEVSVKADDGNVSLTVSNRQASLDGADACLVVEPFWSRPAAGRESGHSGLGLALVEALAQVCGFELILEIEANEAGDTDHSELGTFTARLVLAAEAPPVRSVGTGFVPLG